ncbi:MAG: hypothetical protein RMZ69_09915 [Nostoc sp. ChiQUE01a]|nr:hypothetical protein [Nostoc sp. ChiQUE01a]
MVHICDTPTQVSPLSILCHLNPYPESIAQNFPLLSLEQVYGAITFYLANRELIDHYLKAGEQEFEKLQESFRHNNPLLYQKLKAAQLNKQSQT